MLNQVLSNQHGSVCTHIEGIHFVIAESVDLPTWPVEKGAQVILYVNYFALSLVPHKFSASGEKELVSLKVVLRFLGFNVYRLYELHICQVVALDNDVLS